MQKKPRMNTNGREFQRRVGDLATTAEARFGAAPTSLFRRTFLFVSMGVDSRFK
jgi:hypothetical protein